MSNPNIVNVTSILGNTLTTTLITTVNTTILVNAVSSNQVWKINTIQASNTGASAANATVSVDNGSSTRSLITSVSVPNAATLTVTDKTTSFYLTEGYSIKSSASTSSSIDLLISYEIIS